jgi:lipopolysaccharide export system protein LptA
MKTLLTAVGSALLLAAFAAAQSKFTYRDASGNLIVNAAGGRVVRLEDGFRLTLQGQVSLTSKSQGVTLKAASVQSDIAGQSTLQLRTLTASTGVDFLKADGTRTTRITASKATYTAGANDTILLTGPTRLTSSDTSKGQSLIANGSRGKATIDAQGADKARLISAELVENVSVTLREARSEGAISSMVVTGQRLEIVNGTSPTITVRGGVKIVGQGANNIGSFTNLSKAIFTLNGAGEVVGFETEAAS